MNEAKILEWLGPGGDDIWRGMKVDAVSILRLELPRTSMIEAGGWNGAAAGRKTFVYAVAEDWVVKYKRALKKMLHAKQAYDRHTVTDMLNLVSSVLNWINANCVKIEDRTYQLRQNIEQLNPAVELQRIRPLLDWLPKTDTACERVPSPSASMPQIETSTAAQQNERATPPPMIPQKRKREDESDSLIIDLEADSINSLSIVKPRDEVYTEVVSFQAPTPIVPDEAQSPTLLKFPVRKSVTWSRARIRLHHFAMKDSEVYSLSIRHWLADPQVSVDKIPLLRHWLHAGEFYDLYKDDFMFDDILAGRKIQDLNFNLYTKPGEKATWRPFSRLNIVAALEEWEDFVEHHNTDPALDPDMISLDLSDGSEVLDACDTSFLQ